MTRSKTTRRRNYSYRPAKRRSSPVSRARRAAKRRGKVISLWKKRLLVVVVLILLSPVFARAWLHIEARDAVYSEISEVPKCEVAIVLGALVHRNGHLSTDLADRVTRAVELYEAGRVRKLLMSGDNRFAHYNEPEHMRDYAIKLGVPPEDVKADYAGRRTFDTAYRAKHIFGIDRCVIVSQAYHLDRAVFLCRSVGIQAYGLAGLEPGGPRAQIREFPACLSALADVYLLHPKPVLGKRERI
jgi:SanA protein